VHEEYLSLPGVPARGQLAGVRLTAAFRASNHSITQPPGLALRADETAVDVENQVVALIDAEREQDVVETSV
jgi:hypothetical protein